MGTGVSGFATYAHFDELDEPLDTQEGVLSPAERKARARENLGLAGLNGSAITPLTDTSGGTADNTIAAIPAATAASTDTSAASLTSTNASINALKNAVADLAAKVNALITRTASS